MSEKDPKELLSEANALFAEHELDKALALYRQVAALDESEAWAYSRIGAILAQKGDLDAAEESLQMAIQLNPNLAQAHSNLGNVYYTRGRYQEALDLYKRAIELDGDNYIYHENLHAAYKKLGKVSEAVHHLKRSYTLKRQHDKAEAKEKLKGMQRKAGCLSTSVLVLVVLGVGMALLLR